MCNDRGDRGPPHAVSSPRDCPVEESLLAFARGRLGGSDRAEVIEHLDGCVVCREVVVTVARDEEPSGAHGEERARLTHIGRYELVRPIGAGAMGVVFEARDPELDRSVALKLLRRQALDGDDRRLEQRLLGEARALARLAHPNVVAAFEVARHEGELYLVMELVEGPTLTGWLEAGPRATSEVVTLLLQAGRGLAAAHAAGIVHRDFKLDNVLVGADGRARVTDFGLASGSLSGPTPDLRGDAIALTMTGALAGTPAFMAPEVLRGGEASEASDQFAFAVSLWAALAGVRPFRGDSVAALFTEIERGEPRTPVGRHLPPRLRTIALRGLAADPATRWPSVPAMLDAIERAVRPRRRWLLAAGFASAAVLAGGVAALTAWAHGERGAACDADHAAAELWGPAAASRVEATLAAFAPANARAATARVAGAVEAWRDRWRDERANACRLGGDAGTRRITCLDLQLFQVETVVGLLATGDRAIAERAVDIARGLPEPRSCARASVAASDDVGSEVRALDQRLAEARALHRVARFPAARDAAAAIVADATTRGRDGVRLRALVLLAESHSDSGDRAAAIATFQTAMELAVARGDDHALATVLVHLVSVYAAGGDLPAHELAAKLAAAALRRAGDDPDLAAMLAMGLCRAGWRRPSDLARGMRDCEDAARRWRALHGADTHQLAWVENNLGLIAKVGERHDDALAHFRRFEELSMRSHGPEYVNVDVARVNAAAALVALGRTDEAEPIFRDLLMRRAWGSAWSGLGRVLRARGAHADAIAAFQAAAAVELERGFGVDRCHSLIAVAEVEADRHDAAAVDTALAAATPVCDEHAVSDAPALMARVRARVPAKVVKVDTVPK